MNRRTSAQEERRGTAKAGGGEGAGERKTRSLVGLTVIELGMLCVKLSPILCTESKEARTPVSYNS